MSGLEKRYYYFPNDVLLLLMVYHGSNGISYKYNMAVTAERVEEKFLKIILVTSSLATYVGTRRKNNYSCSTPFPEIGRI